MTDLVCPYCGSPLTVSLRTEGRPYLTYEVADEIECDDPHCGATWTPSGVATAPSSKEPAS